MQIVNMFSNISCRLISGGRDGTVKIWNYNNGHCLRVMKKGREEIKQISDDPALKFKEKVNQESIVL